MFGVGRLSDLSPLPLPFFDDSICKGRISAISLCFGVVG